ncbi:MAG: cation:proton antiporter [Candidatus Eremiobacterota bacterium]
MGITEDLCMVLVAALLGGLAARAARVPMVLGYILAGLLLSPHTPGPRVVEIEEFEKLADVGVALLMFGIGLEFPLPRLARLKGVALLGTGLQMLATIALGTLLGTLMGLTLVQGIWLGVALSLSSTMVALKHLTDSGYLNTLAGRVMLAMLVVQDLAVIPLMIILPDLADVGGSLHLLAGLAGKAVLVTLMLVWGGGRALPRVLSLIGRTCPRELFTISVVAIGLGTGYATYLLGLSFAFGAFLAGLALSESDYSHHVMSEVGPFRDLFGMLFFVSVGLLIDPVAAATQWGSILLLAVATLAGKAAIFALVTRACGYGNIVPFATGLTLCQVGEFSFVLASTGVSGGDIPASLYNLILVTAVLTMVATPFTARLAPRAYAWWRHKHPAPPLATIPPDVEHLTGHVVVGGYGRVGRWLAEVLAGLGRPYCLVELNPEAAASGRGAGHPVVLGNLASPPILEAARIREACMVVLTLTDPFAANRTVEQVRGERPDLPILARALSLDHIHQLARHGVDEVVQPEVEAGLELLNQCLIRLDVSEHHAIGVVDRLRHHLYTEEQIDVPAVLQALAEEGLKRPVEEPEVAEATEQADESAENPSGSPPGPP